MAGARAHGLFGSPDTSGFNNAANLIVEAGRATGAGYAALGAGIGEAGRAIGRRREKASDERLDRDRMAQQAAQFQQQEARFSEAQRQSVSLHDAQLRFNILSKMSDSSGAELEGLRASAVDQDIASDPGFQQALQAAEAQHKRIMGGLQSLMGNEIVPLRESVQQSVASGAITPQQASMAPVTAVQTPNGTVVASMDSPQAYYAQAENMEARADQLERSKAKNTPWGTKQIAGLHAKATTLKWQGKTLEEREKVETRDEGRRYSEAREVGRYNRPSKSNKAAQDPDAPFLKAVGETDAAITTWKAQNPGENGKAPPDRDELLVANLAKHGKTVEEYQEWQTKQDVARDVKKSNARGWIGEQARGYVGASKPASASEDWTNPKAWMDGNVPPPEDAPSSDTSSREADAAAIRAMPDGPEKKAAAKAYTAKYPK